jgi:nucleotidyltransferase/DNA polymerase involved in DNA repair
MFNIMRRFTPQVGEYSIDEAFADLTGMRRALRGSYETIARKIHAEIARELGIAISAGLSVTKVLAKAASKHRKPVGFTMIAGRTIASFLEGLPVEKVWGIGPATADYLHKMGIRTALEFARLPEKRIRERLTKPGIETWQELRGESVYPVATTSTGRPASSFWISSETLRSSTPYFEDLLKAEKIRELYEAVDALSGKYGKHTLHLGGSHPLEVFGKGRRGAPTVREQTQPYGETHRRHLGLPLFHADFPPGSASCRKTG